MKTIKQNLLLNNNHVLYVLCCRWSIMIEERPLSASRSSSIETLDTPVSVFGLSLLSRNQNQGGLAFSRKHALCQSQSQLWRVSVLLKTAGCGRVSSGSGIRPKYSAGLGKTPELLTGNGICPLLGERDAPLQTLCAYSNSFNSSNAGRFFWS